MTVLSWGEMLRHPPSLTGPVRLTIGVFDGLHIGHRRLLDGVIGGSAVPLVITFKESPLLSFDPSRFPGFILSWRQRLERFESLGIQSVVAIDFSKELSNLSGRAFIRLLMDNLTIQRIVVGQNFRFGKNRDSGSDDLREMLSDSGIDVQVVEPVVWGGGIVSSSRIRTAIAHADFSATRAMLASDYGIDLKGMDVRSDGTGSVAVARRGVRQVLPRGGSYTVTCVGAAGRRPGLLTVDADHVTITTEDCSDITSVDFTETGERSITHAAHEGS